MKQKKSLIETFRDWKKPVAETLTVVGIGLVGFVFFWLPGLWHQESDFATHMAYESAKSDIRVAGIQAALGLALLISAYLARDALRSTRRHQLKNELANAATQMASTDPSAKIAGIYFLKSIQGARHADRELQVCAQDMLEASLSSPG